jgi:hypothetical protein
MDVLNQEYVGKEEYRRIAGGASAPRLKHLKDGSGDAIWTDWEPGEGGMIAPRPEYIPSGRPLVRFGSFRDGAPREEASGPQYFGRGAASGAWWLEWSAYKTIERYSDQIGESVTFAIRLICAIPKEWGDLSYIVQGTTRSPLMAYAGHGRPARWGKGVIDPLARGKPRIEQLYIPGLSEPDLNKKAIIVHSHAPVDPKLAYKGARLRAEQGAAARQRMSRK